MGSMSYNLARNRFYEALEQRLEACPDDEKESVLSEAIDALSGYIIGEVEMNRVAYEVAENPHEIDWPYPVCELCTAGPTEAEYVTEDGEKVCRDHAALLETGAWDGEEHEVKPLRG